MEITKVDKNFKAKEIESFKSNVYKIPNEHFALYGAYYDDEYGFIKIPVDLAESISPGVLRGARCTDGTRFLFSTNSKIIEISGTLYSKCWMHHMPLIASAGFTLCEVIDGKELFIGNLTPSADTTNENFLAQLNLNGGKLRDYILYFPLYSGVTSLNIRLEEGSIVQKYQKYSSMQPILYYGSSITQGGCASRTDNCYQALISKWTNTDYYMLGFSGSAKGEPAMASAIRDIDCGIFVCDYDHNASTLDDLRKTHLPMYKIFREREENKDVPIIFVTRPTFVETQDTAERFEIIRDTYLYAKSIGDNNVYIIDGRKFYPENLREHCSVDGVHPNDLGFYFMAKGIYDEIIANNLIPVKINN